MPGKPRFTIRLDPDYQALLEWYARARAAPSAEIAREVLQAGLVGLLADADLVAVARARAGDPPAVTLAGLQRQRDWARGSSVRAIEELRRLIGDVGALAPALAVQLGDVADQLAGALLTGRGDPQGGRSTADKSVTSAAPAAHPAMDVARSGPQVGIVTRGVPR